MTQRHDCTEESDPDNDNTGGCSDSQCTPMLEHYPIPAI